MWESDLRLWSWQYRANPENVLVRTSYLAALSKARGAEAEKEFMEEIDRIRVRHGGQLPVNVQMCMQAICWKRTTRSRYCICRAWWRLPPIWPDVEGTAGTEGDKSIYSGVLSNYSQALMIFKGDLAGAKKYLLKAQSIVPRGSEYNIVHQLIALEYLEGNRVAALDLYRQYWHAACTRGRAAFDSRQP